MHRVKCNRANRDKITAGVPSDVPRGSLLGRLDARSAARCLLAREGPSFFGQSKRRRAVPPLIGETQRRRTSAGREASLERPAQLLHPNAASPGLANGGH